MEPKTRILGVEKTLNDLHVYLSIRSFVHSLHIELRIVGAKVPNMIGKTVFVYYYSASILVASTTTVVMSLTPCYAALYH